ncbi:hypothetical protein ACIBQ6_34590 [Nonomuraea sp. NPDC049655]|uniref:hypothetical protein n=1 Tax=Nonomuraea sp. NPDC049655 TaxID=3364355 RepID=UPI00379BD272
MSATELPDWQDSKLGTMKRAALWLVAEVGVGNVFTKTQLRDAFPDVAQIDRRMRDLRDHGWLIYTNREDVSLDASQQRFAEQGVPVWEPGRATKSSSSITAAQRRELLVKDGYLCRSCGIGAAENYAGSQETAQLEVARRKTLQPDGSITIELVTECSRCRVGGRELVADVRQIVERIRQLPSFDRKILAGWMADGQREYSEIEKLWAAYRALPATARAEISGAFAS